MSSKASLTHSGVSSQAHGTLPFLKSEPICSHRAGLEARMDVLLTAQLAEHQSVL